MILKEGYILRRYLINFDSEKLPHEHHDIVIIGSGIAGVYTALQINKKYDVLIVTKETIDISNSVLAQGGIAVSLGKKDSPELHLKDTLYAGAGLCEEDSVRVLVNEAAGNIENLCEFGVNFDKKNNEELSLTREGAHSMNRIIHAGDTTGKEVCDKLISVVRMRSNVLIKERTFAVDLITEDGNCKGLLVYDEDMKQYKIIYSNVIICATGGFGQLYSYTTNPEVATGDGVGLAYRAGAELMDMEFIQFHPTVLYHAQNKTFLISEAVRGEGAILRNERGERFMPNYHELNELAPRDVVSRAIFAEMQKSESEHVYLDITFKGKEYLENRFPNIFKTCLEYGIDISQDFIPVAPAEHYCMGGIRTDASGKTNINGFYACGEAACNGIHGANRLASNSLLEGLVFGSKIGREVSKIIDNSLGNNICKHFIISEPRVNKDFNRHKLKKEIQTLMSLKVGIIRNEQGLEYAKNILAEYNQILKDLNNENMIDVELQNMVALSSIIVENALERKESRGAHYRSDFNQTDDEHWKKHIVKKL